MLVARRIRGMGGIPTSSLADVAFLLLVFFMATAVFDQEKGLSIVLPPVGDPTPITPSNLLQLTVRSDGAVEVRRGASPRAWEVRREDVAGVWRRESADNPLLVAVIRTHADAPYRYMVDVLDALQGAGATRVSLQQDGSAR